MQAGERIKSTGGREFLEIDGSLLMQPRTAWGRVLAYRLLRRPERLGNIHYTARPSAGRAGPGRPADGPGAVETPEPPPEHGNAVPTTCHGLLADEPPL